MNFILVAILGFNIYTDILSVRNYKNYSTRVSWELKTGMYFNANIENSYDRLLARSKNSMTYQVGYKRQGNEGRVFQFTTGFDLKLERRGKSYLGKRNLMLRGFYSTPLGDFLKLNPSAGLDFLEYFGTSRNPLDNSGWSASLVADVVPANLRLTFGNESKNLYKELRGNAVFNKNFSYRQFDVFLKYNLERRHQRYVIQQEQVLKNTTQSIDILVKRSFFYNSRVEMDYSGDFDFLDYGKDNFKTNHRKNYSVNFRFFSQVRSLNFLLNFETGKDLLDYKVIRNDEDAGFNRLALNVQRVGNLFGGWSFDAFIERYNYPLLKISPMRDSRKLHQELYIGYNFRNVYTNVLKFTVSRYDLSYIKSYYSANSKYTYKLLLQDQSYFTRGNLQFFTIFELFSQFSIFPYDAFKGIYTRYFLNNLGLKKGESNLWQLKFKFQDQGSFIRDVESGEYFYVKRLSVFEALFLSHTYLVEFRGAQVFSKNSILVRYRKPVNSPKELELKDLGIGIAVRSESLSLELTRMIRFGAKDYFTFEASYSRSL